MKWWIFVPIALLAMSVSYMCDSESYTTAPFTFSLQPGQSISLSGMCGDHQYYLFTGEVPEHCHLVWKLTGSGYAMYSDSYLGTYAKDYNMVYVVKTSNPTEYTISATLACEGGLVVNATDYPERVSPGYIGKVKYTVWNYDNAMKPVMVDLTINGETYSDDFFIQRNSSVNRVIEFEAPDKPGKYTVTLKVSDGEISDTYSWTLSVVESRYAFTVRSCGYPLYIERGSKGTLKVCVTNTGNEGAVYSVDIDGWSSYRISPRTLTLSPNESGKFYINLDADDLLPQTKEVTVKVSDGKTVKSLTYEIYIEKSPLEKYDVSVNFPEQTSSNSTSLLVTIKNTGKFSGRVKLLVYFYPHDRHNLFADERQYLIPAGGDVDYTTNLTHTELGKYTLKVKLLPSGYEEEFNLTVTRSRFTGAFAISGNTSAVAVFVVVLVVVLLVLFKVIAAGRVSYYFM
ncbi:hypothetical protein DRN75_00215 [Nanoarchaeota archaeon]|nr:MAG: hypothetical protein DRN75_00215 [Nanoarchaeota archaeon]